MFSLEIDSETTTMTLFKPLKNSRGFFPLIMREGGFIDVTVEKKNPFGKSDSLEEIKFMR